MAFDDLVGGHAHLPAVVARRAVGGGAQQALLGLEEGDAPALGHEGAPCRPRPGPARTCRGALPSRDAEEPGREVDGQRGLALVACGRSGRLRTCRGTRRTRARAAPRATAVRAEHLDGLGARDGRVRAQRVVRERDEDALLHEQGGGEASRRSVSSSRSSTLQQVLGIVRASGAAARARPSTARRRGGARTCRGG